MAQHAADHGAVEMGATVEYADHQRTYQGFLTLLKYCMGAIAVVLILMAFFLT
jgi:hypothetical protein